MRDLVQSTKRAEFRVSAWPGRELSMEGLDEFSGVRNVLCTDPTGLFICPFVSGPLDKIAKRTGAISSIEFCVENLSDFKLGFLIDDDRRRRFLNAMRNRVRNCGI